MFIRYPIVIFILFFLINPCPSFSWQGEVISVYDGDSLQIRNIKGEIVKIRVYGVDCPEIGQPYGDEARLMTEKVLLGRTVDVVTAQKSKSYGREVSGLLLMDDMIVLQDVLVSAGLAWVDERFCKLPVCELWKLHQRDAISNRRGLWAEKNPIPPWTWRSLRK